MSIDWQLFRTAQIDSLAMVAHECGSKAVVVAGFPDDTLCVIPPSSWDQRRWDVTVDGTIVRRDRFSGDACRGNRFPKRILKTVIQRVDNQIGAAAEAAGVGGHAR